MKSTIGLIGLAIIILAGMTYLGGQIGESSKPSLRPPPAVSTPSPTPPTNASSTTLIYSLSGSGDELIGMGQKTSQSFHITKSEWYINTTCEIHDPQQGSPLLTITIYPEGEAPGNYNFIGIVQTSSTVDKNYVHTSGDFYLQIVAMNIKNWTIDVYE